MDKADGNCNAGVRFLLMLHSGKPHFPGGVNKLIAKMELYKSIFRKYRNKWSGDLFCQYKENPKTLKLCS